MIEYSIIHSKRKTMALQITRDGRVVVRCPMRMPDCKAREFAESHKEWIEANYKKVQERISSKPVFTEQQIKAYRKQARKVLTEKTMQWAEKMGVDYGRIAIRQQATRWGSCSVKGNLNYNWKLILLPEELQDYVVVHELAHRTEMNHSPRFWRIVEREIPDYLSRRRQLRNFED